MSETNQIRINELARQLEVKAKTVIDYLPEIGVTEKKTHSSSIDLPSAEKVRKHFQQIAQAEAEAEAAAAKAKTDREAALKAARMRPPAASAGAAAVAPGARPAIPPGAVQLPAAAKPGAPSVHPVAAKPALPTGAAAPPPIARPTTPLSQQPRPATAAPPPARPAISAKPGVPVKQPPAVTRQGAPEGLRRPPAGPQPGQPIGGVRPAAGGRPQRAAAPGAQFPGRFPPGARPGQPPSGRPGIRPGMLPPPPDRFPPKAEPGKPLYARKPAPRQRPVIDKREAEGERKLHPVRTRPSARSQAVTAPAAVPVQREPRSITITEGVTIRELAEKLDVRAKDLLKTLLDRGVFASINQALDVPTATSLAQAFNGIVSVVTFEEGMVLEVAKEETKENLRPRPPVVTVMGHVDHGKTSLLDAIRQTDVAGGEAGGITQHIGAYKVPVDGRSVVFVDTPGHEAFTRMRARGAKVTDMVILVVAADDGVMPQTREAVDHARAARVPIVVAVNKIDKPGAQPERVKRQLAELGLTPEDWGGDTIVVEVSAKQKKNLERLLEMLLLVADMRELKANAEAPASGTVIESRVDKGRGPVATVLVQNGTLHTGDFFICGSVFGKVRAMFDDHGRPVKNAPPSTPVEVLGLQSVPEAGDQFQVTDEAKARHIVEYRQAKQREAALARTAAGSRVTLDQLHEQLKAGEVKELAIVIKADVQGSVEVLGEMLPKLSTDQVKLKVIHASVGAVSETDVLLASASGAIIIAFNVRPDRKAADLAQQEKVDIRAHDIIYEVSDEMKKALAGLLEPVVKETYLGRAEVRETFRIKGVGTIAGCYVQDGSLKRDAEVRVLRDSALIYSSRLSSLKRFKDDTNEVRAGFECGAGIANFNDVKVGDVLECFQVQRVSPAEAAAQGVTSRA